MEEPKLRPGFPGDRSQAAAEKLRALRERADQALAGHRTRLGDIETQLNERVRQLAEEFGTTLGAEIELPTPEGHDDEIAALRRQVDEGHARHEKFVEQLTAARKQLDAIQSQPCASCQQAAQQLAAADEELRRVREQLETATREHQEDLTRHEQFVEQLTAARQAIGVLQHAAGESSNELRGELEAARQATAALDQRLASALSDAESLRNDRGAAETRTASLERDLDSVRRELTALKEQSASLDRDRGAAASESAAMRERVEAATAKLKHVEGERDDLSHRLAASEDESRELTDAIAKLQAQTAAMQVEQTGLVEMLAAADAETQEATLKLKAIESERLSLSLSLSQAESVSQEFRNRHATIEQELEALRTHAAQGAEADDLRKQIDLAKSEAAAQARTVQELTESLADAQGELASLHDSMTSPADLEAARRECQAAQVAIGDLQAALAVAQADAAQSQADAAAVRKQLPSAEEFGELDQKFQLALADVQKFKRNNSALRDELAGRPEARDEESPELIAVRSERDALSIQVRDLEEAAATAGTVDDDARQVREDLQRRFEMAVDDVRQLKQENARLRDELAASGKGKGDVAASIGSDWAAQRARLMASLEEEDDAGDVTPERGAERATVQKAIAATDRVVAGKDEEIAELRAALEARGDAGEGEAAAAEREALLAADDVVAAERQRLAKLTAEWEGKLRAAELEFSIERAKLSREQVAVRDKMIEMQSAAHAVSDPADAGKPRRRWLAALGLHEDQDEVKKK